MSHIIRILASTGSTCLADMRSWAWTCYLDPGQYIIYRPGQSQSTAQVLAIHALQAWPVTIYGHLLYYLGTGQYWFCVVGRSPYHPQLTAY
ncbi:hypothetical protein P692DRAFT_20136963 [Suillus brevipes Sb2]|nr:hypothetical protein P692DRAFT_20136963 [Suillus brevipes Sb2]